MIVRYDNTLEDLGAFARYHYAHSPAVKKTKFAWMAVVFVLSIAGSLLVAPTEDLSQMEIVVLAIVLAGIFSLVLNQTSPASVDRQVRRAYKEGTNKGVLGEHELEIDEDGLVERTEVNETHQSWHGVERIEETDEHAFIYTSSIMAHGIPKRGVIAGDPEAFIVRARQLWRAATQHADAQHADAQHADA